MSQPLLAPTFLFRFAVPCRRLVQGGSAAGFHLPAEYRLPAFGTLEDRPVFADVRLGWTDAGLVFWLSVQGKQQAPWCRASRVEDSDGVKFWIDTRDTHNIHRASRFCHQFVFLPFGAGTSEDQPLGSLVPINRAREHPKPVAKAVLSARSRRLRDGYVLEGSIPAEALTGYDPLEHPRLGFTYAVIDRELGCQTFTVGPEFPFEEDPSLWGTLELVG